MNSTVNVICLLTIYTKLANNCSISIMFRITFDRMFNTRSQVSLSKFIVLYSHLISANMGVIDIGFLVDVVGEYAFANPPSVVPFKEPKYFVIFPSTMLR